MNDRHSIGAAHDKLSRLVREAERGKTVELTRYGEPVAALIGYRELERLTGRYRPFADALRDFSAKVNLPALAIDPDQVFGAMRERT